MIKFENPLFLWLLLAAPLWFGLIWFALRRRRKAAHLVVAEPLFMRIAYAFSATRLRWKSALWLVAWIFAVVGLANPQVGTKLEEIKREGIDIIIALDLSNSMLCEDIRPSRLESAKNEILKFVSGLKGDRVGLVAFAGTALTHCPLTTDYGAVKLLVKIMGTDLVPEQGTAVADAITQAQKSLKGEETTSKVLIIITDGEDQEEEAVEIAKSAAEESGIKIYTVGLGTPAGAPIPIKDANGRAAGFKRGKTGEIIVTRLNEELLEQIAEAGGGKYLRGTQSAQELQTIWSDIETMEKAEFGKKQFTSFESRFAYLVFPAFLLLIGEFFVGERKRNRSWGSLFAKKTALK